MYDLSFNVNDLSQWEKYSSDLQNQLKELRSSMRAKYISVASKRLTSSAEEITKSWKFSEAIDKSLTI